MRVRYRLWQVWQTLFRQSLSEAEWLEITSCLSPAELTLFKRYTEADRRHAYRVFKSLRAAGHAQPPLLAAALLHDIGKTRISAPLWARSLAVVGERFFPRRSARWAEGKETAWHRPFMIKKHHAAWGAEMAGIAGSDPLVVCLIRRHQEPAPEPSDEPEDQLLLLLQWADNQN